MFTGIVARAGRVVECADRLVVDAGELSAEVAPGDSVAVNGVCLTAVEVDEQRLVFDLLRETLERTSLGALAPGGPVNLELALRASDRLGGHFVSGHVDGCGRIDRLAAEPGQTVLEVVCDKALSDQMVLKGSVALDGVSLTLSAVSDGRLQVCLIPHTLAVTNFGSKQVGDSVNIETDLVGKYVMRLLEGMEIKKR